MKKLKNTFKLSALITSSVLYCPTRYSWICRKSTCKIQGTVNTVYQAYITILGSGNFDKGRNSLYCEYPSLKQFFISSLLSHIFRVRKYFKHNLILYYKSISRKNIYLYNF